MISKASEHRTRFQDCIGFLYSNFELIPDHVQAKFLRIANKEHYQKRITGDEQSWCFAIKHLIEIRNGKTKL